MSKSIEIKNLQRKKRKQIIKDGMVFKEVHRIKRNEYGDSYLIIGKDDKICSVEYSHDRAVEMMNYFNTK